MQNSNNKKKRKSLKAILIILFTIIVACILMVCGYIIINHFADGDAPTKGEKQEAKENKKEEKKSLADEALKDGGSLLVYVPDVADTDTVTEAEIEIAMCLLRTRLDSKGYLEAIIESDDSGKITIAIPNCEIPDEATEFLKTTGKLEFIDASGNIIMDGSPEFITKAEPLYGQTSTYGESQHYVQINFTQKGREKFKEATSAAVQAGGDMQFISIAIDGQVQMSPRVNEVIDSDSCIITGDYNAEEARDVSNLINSGLLTFDLKPVKLEYVEGE